MACPLDQSGYGIPMINLNPANFTLKRMDRPMEFKFGIDSSTSRACPAHTSWGSRATSQRRGRPRRVTRDHQASRTDADATGTYRGNPRCGRSCLPILNEMDVWTSPGVVKLTDCMDGKCESGELSVEVVHQLEKVARPAT